MKIDGKPNVAPNLTTVIVNDSNTELTRDAAGAAVRPTKTEIFVPEVQHHRMAREFQDFARMIDEQDGASADRYMQETLDVMKLMDRI